MALPSFLSMAPSASQWEQIGFRHHHGICVPLSSLHSEKSCGIGEFPDLHLLIDWCKSVGFDCLQLLPVHDSGQDPSPYNLISSHALNPIYIGLSELPHLTPSLKKKLRKFSCFQTLSQIYYQKVRSKKLEWLREYFEEVFFDLQKSNSYQAFLFQHRNWLPSYCLFQAHKKKYGGPWETWPAQPGVFESALLDFPAFLQYLAYSQLSEAKSYATQCGIFLKGDLPILVSRDSVDVFSNRSLFRLDACAGAPPDYYNPSGQKWWFPVPSLQESSLFQKWWIERVHAIESLFHIYRIDHVVGLFRLWTILLDKSATEGFFVPSDQTQWKSHGFDILLGLIKASSLFPMAEDLGTIPPEVPQTLKFLGICGTKVIRWERRWGGDRSFIPLQTYEPLSMTTVSTHDSETLQLWWKDCPEEASAFAKNKGWKYEPVLSIDHRLEILQEAHHSQSLFHINLLQEYLALFSELVHADPSKERINVPGTILPSNWSYRFCPSLEKLQAHDSLREQIQKILK